MAMRTANYSGLGQDVSRGPSESIWGQFPLEDMIQDPSSGLGANGYMFQDDFLGGGFGLTTNAEGNYAGDRGWGTNICSSGVIGGAADTTNLPLEGGILGTLPASTLEIVLAATGGGGFGFLDASSTTGKFRGKMGFECSLAVSSIAANSGGIFVGLVSNVSRVTGGAARLTAAAAANGLVNTNDFFGFYKPSVSGFTNNANPNKVLTGSLVNDFLVAYNVNAGTIQFPGSASNLWTLGTNTGTTGLVAATFTAGNFTTVSTMKVKLGWVFDPTPACPSLTATAAITSNQTVGSIYKPIIKFYVNGQLSSSFLVPADVQASSFPSNWMVPVIAHRWGSSGAGSAYFDWIRVAQLGTY